MDSFIYRHRFSRFRLSSLLIFLFIITPVLLQSQETASGMELEFFLDGQRVPLKPPSRLENGKVLVPIYGFSKLIGTKVKVLEGSGKLAVCKEDLCIPLSVSKDVGSPEEVEVFVPLQEFSGALGLHWEVREKGLWVNYKERVKHGLGIGDIPPSFNLPDLYTGELVSSTDYRGKKTIFFMWASW